MRIFFDTNVLVSAFTARGISADLFRYVLAEHEPVTGEVNLEELERVLRDRFMVAARDVSEVLSLLRTGHIVPRPGAPSPVRVRDPDDRWVLASAVEEDVEMLVTGDKDLLEVAGEVEFPIVTPRGCWEQLRQIGGADSKT